MIYESGRPDEFDPAFFEPYRELIRRLVFWPVLGNHDVRTAGGRPWRDAFWTPANNPAGSEHYYSFDHGNAHVVVLDSNASLEPDSPQAVFLDDDLGAHGARWTFVAFHHTIYTSGTRHGSDLARRAALVPVLDRHAVDVVFMGHEHVYERTIPLRGDVAAAPGEGTVYVTTGGGGRDVHTPHGTAFTAAAEGVLHFVRISVDGDTLELEMVRDDGSIGDRLGITKPPSTHTPSLAVTTTTIRSRLRPPPPGTRPKRRRRRPRRWHRIEAPAVVVDSGATAP